MSRRISICLLPLLAAGAPAFAQEAATTFTGLRAEATVGWDQLRFNLDEVGAAPRARVSDLDFGGAVGYDMALTPTLIGGVEAGVTSSDAAYANGDALDGEFLRRRREIDLAARLGTPITPNALLYGKLGYANLQVRQAITSAGLTGSDLRDLDGLLVGAGVEVKVSPKTYIKSEYRYTNFQDGYTGNAVVTGVGIRF